MTGGVTIQRGTAVGVLTPATEADFKYINSHLRAMDKLEQDYFVAKYGIDKIDGLSELESAWTLHLCGEIVGYVGLQVPPLQCRFSTARYMPMLSTENVEHHPVDYARLSKPTLEWVMEQAPKWVMDFYTLPLAKYGSSVRWQERVMGWKRVCTIDTGGEMAILLHKHRRG